MSKCMITIAVLLVSAIGCKTTPRSEEKGLAVAARSKELGNMIEVFGRAISNAMHVDDLLKVREALQKAVFDSELGDLKKLIKDGGKMGEAASIGYYRALKKTQDDFLKKVDFRAEKIAVFGRGSGQLLVSQTIHERAMGALRYIESISAEMRNFSSLLKNRAKQVDELVSQENSIVEKFNTAVSLCCRHGDATKGLDLGLAGKPIVKNKKAFKDIFNEEHRSTLTGVEASKPHYYQTVERLVNASLKDHSYSFANSVYPNRVREQHAAILSDFDAARTELSNALRDYRELLEARIGD